MSDIPPRWAGCKIGEVTKIVGGSTPSSKDPDNFSTAAGIPWITPADLSGYEATYISRGARYLTEKGFSSCSAQRIPAGSVLFSSRAPVGYAAIAANELTTNQGFKSFVLPEGLESRFVYYYLRHIKPVAESMATGTTFKELSGARSAELPMTIAPLNEQKRIADKLDSLLGRVTRCREHLDRVPGILKQFRQAVLAAAMSGKLTEEWRKKNRHPQTPFAKRSLRELIGEPLRNGKSVRDGVGTPVLRLSSLKNGAIDWAEAKNGDWGQLRVEPFLIKNGDFLVARGNGSLDLVGRGALVTGAANPVAFPDTMIRIRPNPSLIDPNFLKYVWDTDEVRHQIETTARTTAGIWKISQPDLEALIVPIPKLDEQLEIVRRIQSLFAYADRLDQQFLNASVSVQLLPQALLAKAFRGELEPQDPNDEPAEKLLERVRAERAAEKEKPKRKEPRMAAPKAKRLSAETVKEKLRAFSKDSFSFDDIWNAVPGNYEDLKDVIFEILQEKPKPAIKQYFDKERSEMRFKRVA